MIHIHLQQNSLWIFMDAYIQTVIIEMQTARCIVLSFQREVRKLPCEVWPSGQKHFYVSVLLVTTFLLPHLIWVTKTWVRFIHTTYQDSTRTIIWSLDRMIDEWSEVFPSKVSGSLSCELWLFFCLCDWWMSNSHHCIWYSLYFSGAGIKCIVSIRNHHKYQQREDFYLFYLILWNIK